MALDVETSALLVYRAASAGDAGAERITLEAAMAKLHATEAAQRVIDAAMQLQRGRGAQRGSVPELYPGRSAHCASTRAPARSRSW
jgi:acyl-CoA dehydrogenase